MNTFIKDLVKKVIPGPALGVIKRLKNKHYLKNFKRRIVNRSYGGHELNIMIADDLARGWYDRTRKRPKDIEFLSKNKLKEGALVFDLGAHQCVIAMLLAKEVGPSGKVVALEANGHNHEIACINRDLNKIENLEIVHAAIGDADGEIFFNNNLNGAIDENAKGINKSTVWAYKLDSLIKKYGKPDIIYMDIEGYECRVIKGALNILEMNIDWVIEMHGDDSMKPYGGSSEDILRELKKRNFKLYYSKSQDEEFLELADQDVSIYSHLIAIKQ